MACKVNLFAELNGTPDVNGCWYLIAGVGYDGSLSISADDITYYTVAIAAGQKVQKLPEVPGSNQIYVDLSGETVNLSFIYVSPAPMEDTFDPAWCNVGAEDCTKCATVTANRLEIPNDLALEVCLTIESVRNLFTDAGVSPANYDIQSCVDSDDPPDDCGLFNLITGDYNPIGDMIPNGTYTFVFKRTNTVNDCDNCEFELELTLLDGEVEINLIRTNYVCTYEMNVRNPDDDSYSFKISLVDDAVTVKLELEGYILKEEVENCVGAPIETWTDIEEAVVMRTAVDNYSSDRYFLDGMPSIGLMIGYVIDISNWQIGDSYLKEFKIYEDFGSTPHILNVSSVIYDTSWTVYIGELVTAIRTALTAIGAVSERVAFTVTRDSVNETLHIRFLCCHNPLDFDNNWFGINKADMALEFYVDFRLPNETAFKTEYLVVGRVSLGYCQEIDCAYFQDDAEARFVGVFIANCNDIDGVLDIPNCNYNILAIDATYDLIPAESDSWCPAA